MDSVFKIGRTKDLKKRLREHEASRAQDLEIVFVFRTDDVDAVEACVKGTLLKQKYARYRGVFKVDLDALKEVIYGCDALQGKLKLAHRATGPSKPPCYATTARTASLFSGPSPMVQVPGATPRPPSSRS